MEIDGYSNLQIYDAVYGFTLGSYPSPAAIGNSTILLMTTDQSTARLPPVISTLPLHVLSAGPTVVNAIPIVEVEAGQTLSYAIPNATFNLNIPTGALTYTLAPLDQYSDAVFLPKWLTFSNGVLGGAANEYYDVLYDLAVTATDAHGASNSTELKLYVRAACPTGQFRHFRLRILPMNNNSYYQLAPDLSYYSYPKRSTVCSLAFGGDAPKPDQYGWYYPQPSYNTSGTRYQGGGQCSNDPPVDPSQAFADLQSYGYCYPWSTWKVRSPCHRLTWSAHEM